MCIIVYKPIESDTPSKEILKKCFNVNNDGAGYMYVKDEKVHINKGFSDFDKFYESLLKDISTYKSPFVLHFRIGTHGENVMSNTHPFPLSKNMIDLTLLETDTNIGIAHNGMLTLPNREYSRFYSDTMLFITNYLSLLIKSNDYYKDKDIVKIINNLLDYDKLAIMSNDGHVELFGSFIEDDGCYYSNWSYKPFDKHVDIVIDENKYDKELAKDYRDEFLKPSTENTLFGHYWDEYWCDHDAEYRFDNGSCPKKLNGDNRYCAFCSKRNSCTLRNKCEC